MKIITNKLWKEYAAKMIGCYNNSTERFYEWVDPADIIGHQIVYVEKLVRETLTIPKPWSLFFDLVDSLKGGVINEHGPFDVFNKLFDETIEKLQEQT